MKKRFKLSVLGWVICLTSALFYSYEYFLRIQPSVMVHELMHQFHVTAATFGILVGLYYFAYTPTQLIVGVSVDRYGPRKILTMALCFCIGGLTLFAYSNNVYLAGLGRILIGFGSAFAFVSVLKLAVLWIPRRQFALFSGVVTSLAMLSGIVGDVGMTHLMTLFGWREVLLLGIIAGIILVPVMWFSVREKPLPTAKAAHAAQLSLKEMIQASFKIILNPQMWLAGIIGAMFYLSLSAFAELWGIPFLRVVHHLTPKAAANCNAFVFLGWLIGSPIAGWWSDYIESRRQPLMITAILAIIAITVVIYVPHLQAWHLKLLLFLFGLFCSAEIIVFAVGKENNKLRVSGAALAVINMIVMLGGFIFQPLIGLLLDWRWSGALAGHVRLYSVSDYQHAMIVLPIGMVIAVICTWVMKESHPEAGNE